MGRLTLHRKSKAVWSKKCTMQCKFLGDLFFRFWLDLSLRCWFIFLMASDPTAPQLCVTSMAYASHVNNDSASVSIRKK